MSGTVIPCVGAVIVDDLGKLLLIKRGHDPGAGLWSLPGGRVEPGETDAEALVREVREETGLEVTPGRLLGQVRRSGPHGAVFDIRDYFAIVVVVVGGGGAVGRTAGGAGTDSGSGAGVAGTGSGAGTGTLRAGDDAAQARWVDPHEMRTLPLTAGLIEALTEWGVL